MWTKDADRILYGEKHGKQCIRMKDRSDNEKKFLVELKKKIDEKRTTIYFSTIEDICTNLRENEFKDCGEFATLGRKKNFALYENIKGVVVENFFGGFSIFRSYF